MNDIYEILKYIAWGASISGLVFFLVSRKEDYDGHSIDGEWQLTKKIGANGLEEEYSSVFYRFSKGSFECKILKGESVYKRIEGTYIEKNGRLVITVNDTMNLTGFENEAVLEEDTQEDPKYADWIFDIKKLTSSRLELGYNDELLLFRKY